MPDNKKSAYVTYKGTKIEPLSDHNIYSWLDDAMNIFIIDETWDYVDPKTAPKLVTATEKDATIANKPRIVKAVLSLLISHDTWQAYRDMEYAHIIWEELTKKAK